MVIENIEKLKGNTLSNNALKNNSVEAPVPTVVIEPQIIKGIYRLEGNSLTYCLSARGKPRPKRFAVPKGSGQTLVVLTRQETRKANIQQSVPKEIRVRSADQNKTPFPSVKNVKRN